MTRGNMQFQLSNRWFGGNEKESVMSEIPGKASVASGSQDGFAQPEDDFVVDVCISYREGTSRHKAFFRSSRSLVETLLAWKRKGHSDLLLTWGTTPHDVRLQIEWQIARAGIAYRTPASGPQGATPTDRKKLLLPAVKSLKVLNVFKLLKLAAAGMGALVLGIVLAATGESQSILAACGALVAAAVVFGFIGWVLFRKEVQTTSEDTQPVDSGSRRGLVWLGMLLALVPGLLYLYLRYAMDSIDLTAVVLLSVPTFAAAAACIVVGLWSSRRNNKTGAEPYAPADRPRE